MRSNLMLTLSGVVFVFLARPAPAQTVEESGWGTAPIIERADDLSQEHRQEIQERLDRNAKLLRELGLLPDPAPGAVASHPTMDWPLRMPKLSDPGSHYIWAYVDQNPSYPNALLDFSCGNRTYDRSTGYNHGGTDYVTWPFQWLRQAQGAIEIVAAADGTILGKDDGNADHNCGNPSVPWNAVYVRHPDGSTAWYGHMQLGSLTPKPVGATVAKGEYLGLVGSSGDSAASHLHFELYDSAGFLNDPYQGTCNSMNATSWWAGQRPYSDSALNRFATGYAPPVFPPCPEVERPNEAWDFNPGDRAFFVTYFRDQLAGQTSANSIRRPDGTVYSTWTDNPAAAYSGSVYWFRSFLFASNVPVGIWRYEVTTLGKTYARTFRVSAVTGSGRVPGELLEDAPVIGGKAGASVTLTWDASCVPSDTDYEVYEGTVGSWTTHAPVLCSTGGATTATIAPSSGSAYYLVVPTNGSQEGSYGWNGVGVERPLGSSSCRSKVVGGSCPRCGDNIFEAPEVCDRLQLNGQTCQSQGFTDGILGCATSCQAFDTSGCF